MNRVRILAIKWLTVLLLLVIPLGCQKDTVVPMGGNTPDKQVDAKSSEAPINKTTSGDMSSSDKIETPVNQDKSVSQQSNSSSTTLASQASSKMTSEQKTTSQNTTTTKKPTSTGTKPSGSTTSPSSSQSPSPTPKAQYVTLSVIGDQGKVILPPTSVKITKGEMDLEVTLSRLKSKGIQYSVRGANSTAYVEGIDNLYEFDHGPKSGWVAKLNHQPLTKSAGVTPVEAGDLIEWIYTTTGE